MNRVVLIGNLTKDPDVRYSTGANQTAICRFTVAVNDKRKNPQTGQYEDSPSFIPVVVFGKQAENCQKYTGKGSKVCIEGRIQTGSYEKNGQKVYTTEVIASGIEYLSKREQTQQTFNEPQPFGQDQQAFNGQQAFTQDQQGFGQAQQAFEAPPGFEQIQDDIPFA